MSNILNVSFSVLHVMGDNNSDNNNIVLIFHGIEVMN